MEKVISRHAERHSARGLTSAKLAELRTIAERWHSARTRYIRDYSHPRYAERAIRRPREIREQRRAQGWAPVPISVAYHQTALLSALDGVRADWEFAITAARRRVGRDRGLSRAERSWALDALAHAGRMQAALDRPTAIGPEHQKVACRLRRALLAARPRRRRRGRPGWFDVDVVLYRTFERTGDRHFRGQWIAITGLQNGRRVNVPLAGPTPLFGDGTRVGRAPSLRVEVGDRVVLHWRERVMVVPRSGTSQLGIDKGYRALITVSDGSPDASRAYGAGADELIARLADTTALRLRHRRMLAAHERSIRNSQPAKAKRIRRSCLGSRKITAVERAVKMTLRAQIGRYLNELFARESARTVFVESLHFRAGRRSHPANRRLGRWLKGYLQQRLRYKAELNGVELIVVNAAYTSQSCPRCWFTSRSNRQAVRFRCGDCGYAGSADAVAATNVLLRGRDPAISRFTPLAVVKETLDARWRSARSGRAWGSQDGGEDVADMGATPEAVTSSEQPRGTSRSISGLQTMPIADPADTAR